MKTLLFLTMGIFLFLGVMVYILKKQGSKKRRPKQGDTIEKNIKTIKQGEKESHLGKRLFYKIKSGLMRK